MGGGLRFTSPATDDDAGFQAFEPYQGRALLPALVSQLAGQGLLPSSSGAPPMRIAHQFFGRAGIS
jgi:hypothetical protein